MFEDEDLMLSTLEHFAYCPRQAALILEGVWQDNHLTVEGDVLHQHVDTHGVETKRGIRVHRRVALRSAQLKIRGIADVIEQNSEGELVPVEYKRGRGGGLWSATVQVVGQALCLAEMTGRSVGTGAIFLGGEHRRVEIDIEEHRSEVVELICHARAVLSAAVAPTVAYQPRLCHACSIRVSCQPRGVEWA